MFALIISVVLLVLGIVAFIVGRALGKASGGRTNSKASFVRVAGVALMVFAILPLVFSSFTTVPAKHVGIKTSFGKVSPTTLSPGINFKMPWEKVHRIDATIQTDEYFGDSAIRVRTGDGMETDIWMAVRWEINPEAANVIYQDYRSDDPTTQFRNSVIDTQLKASTQTVMAEYNPIANLTAQGQEATDASFTPDVKVLAQAIEKELVDNLKTTTNEAGNEVPLANIISVTVSGVNWSADTQKKINDFNTEVANTRVATQREQTAIAEARANEALSKSISEDPNVLVSKCFDGVNTAIERGYQLPAGYSCWGGSTGVVIPSAPATQPQN